MRNLCYFIFSGIWLEREQSQIEYYFSENTYFPYACATCSKLPWIQIISWAWTGTESDNKKNLTNPDPKPWFNLFFFYLKSHIHTEQVVYKRIEPSPVLNCIHLCDVSTFYIYVYCICLYIRCYIYVCETSSQEIAWSKMQSKEKTDMESQGTCHARLARLCPGYLPR